MLSDETTGLIRELKKDGIGYATYEHTNSESTARIVTVNNTNPGASQYPYQRRLCPELSSLAITQLT
ncbi:hypothetical protein CEN45_08660 [Fischerella thermalis CCMEE 5198]|uniref:hypothetical protein n=1 Tax=Fischerella thermalis TaxID=372787 RepID=UPI000C805B48|nr:hypothetical protein [Fischerella thermalis]PMB06238.1 hypothetical protein CI594_02185 [Fischerella thermalis CCMEE 5196]PMB24263.1 hypothetical protein CEN45_08660 [Fischerella thermalis CCMEE 5198]PMB53577.1 hypothetical protein CEN39_03770 [Fischerella thermalis CCMEE 5201]